ncbi:MAG: rRNA maturation RNase YbeY [Anaerolineae bacterium]
MAYRIIIDAQVPLDPQVNLRTLEQAAAEALVRTGQPDDAGVAITLVDDVAIQCLNRDYRGVDEPTDVLSFAAREGENFIVPEGLLLELGDVIISYETAVRQAQAMGHNPIEELALLTIHGCLHLTGLDHDTPEGQARMWKLQDEGLQALGYALRSYVPDEGLGLSNE